MVPQHAQHTPSPAGSPDEVPEPAGERTAGVTDPPARDAVLIFVREPVAGRVKTRLAAEIGAEAALRVYARLAEHAVGEALRLGPRARVRVHYTPADAGSAVEQWLGAAADFLPQSAGDLGDRMRNAFAVAFAEGFRRVVIIGSDLPGLSTALLRRAFTLLDRHPVVLGPAYDGGYYLLGMRQLQDLFQGVPWSTDQVLDCTLQRLQRAGIHPALLEPLRDVDHAADLTEELR